MTNQSLSATAAPAVNIPKKKKTPMGEVWRRLRKNKAAMIGLVIVILEIFIALFAGVIFDYEEVVIHQNIPERLQAPSWAHPFGTDEMGRDLLARVTYGARISLLIGFSADVISLAIGLALGAVSGFFGKRTDMLIMRLMDILLAIPGTLLAIAIVAALGTSIQNLVIALAVSGIPIFARVVRGAVLTVKDMEYIESAKAIGAKDSTIIFEHILPNCLAPIIVQTTFQMAVYILITAGLSFIGLGIQAPMPEWGCLLSSGRAYIREYSYMTLFPGMAIVITILAFNLLGDGLRDALDPRLK